MLTDVFPGDASYIDSQWASWERRIQRGHEDEEKVIERICKQRKTTATNPFYDPAEWAGENYHETCRLTNSMYAALIVAIWSETEHFLKDMVRVCYQAFGKRKMALETTQSFCEDSLAGKHPQVTLDQCIRALKQLQTEVPYRFDEISRALTAEVGVQLPKCANYATVDAIRILNNSFKHSRGSYLPQNDQSHTKIDKQLLKQWAIVDEHMNIDYSKLPLRDLVAASHIFCGDLLDKIEQALKNRITVGPNPVRDGRNGNPCGHAPPNH